MLGVGAGALDQGGEHPVVDALRVAEAGHLDVAGPAADRRELAGGGSLAARLGSKDSPSNSSTPSSVALYGS